MPTDSLINETRNKFLNDFKFWNPQYVYETSWDTYIPLSEGVTLQVNCYKKTNGYNINLYVITLGDIECNREELSEFIEEAIKDIFPVEEHIDVSDIGDYGTEILSISSDDIDEVTESITVSSNIGNKSMQLNVHPDCEDKTDYALRAAKKYQQKELKRFIETMTGVNTNDIEFTVEDRE